MAPQFLELAAALSFFLRSEMKREQKDLLQVLLVTEPVVISVYGPILQFMQGLSNATNYLIIRILNKLPLLSASER